MDETGSNWGDWFQDIAGNVVKTAAQLKVLESVQRGQQGYYLPGQSGIVPAYGTTAGISSGTLLLVGLAVVAFLVLKD